MGKAREALTLTFGSIHFVKLPVILLAARLFTLNGIWASGAVSELILCAVALIIMKSYQEKMMPMEPMAYCP